MLRYAIVALFILTYVGISARKVPFLPIGRPAFALLGACLLVGIGSIAGRYGLTPDEALRAVEPNTLGLLLGMMILSAVLGEAGFFTVAAKGLGSRIASPAKMLWAVTIGCGILSAFLVNDAVCLLATPLVVAVAKERGLARKPLLLAVAMGSNVGSALTLAGNPQNMLIARLSTLTYRGYLVTVALPVMVALVLTAAVIHLMHRNALVVEAEAEAVVSGKHTVEGGLLSGATLALVVVVGSNLGGASLAWSALLGASVALVFARGRAERILSKVEGSVLLFFAALFVVVAALQKTGIPQLALNALGPTNGPEGTRLLLPTLTVGSQLVSNVPLILLIEPWIRTFPNQADTWTLTAVAATLAGNLTPLGSVANIIVLEQGKEKMGFLEYVRVGVPVTLVSMAAAVGLLLLLR